MIGAGLRAVVAEVPAAWRRAGWPWRLAYATGTVLMLVGLAHGFAWLTTGGAWEGSVSYRKPFSFGLSFGLTTVTLAWAAERLGVGGRAAAWLLVPLTVANTSEVVWVSVQRARDVASHFNFDSPFDTALYFLMGGGAITVTAVCVLVLAVTAFRRGPGDPALRAGLRAGFLGLLAAVAVGVVMIGVGNARAVAGQTTGLVTWGAAGNMKATHALGIHGIQALPGLAVFLAGAGVPVRRRLRVVRMVAVAYAALLAAVTVQWLGGRAPADPGAAEATLAGVAVIALVLALLAARAPAGQRGGPAERRGGPPPADLRAPAG